MGKFRLKIFNKHIKIMYFFFDILKLEMTKYFFIFDKKKKNNSTLLRIIHFIMT